MPLPILLFLSILLTGCKPAPPLVPDGVVDSSVNNAILDAPPDPDSPDAASHGSDVSMRTGIIEVLSQIPAPDAHSDACSFTPEQARTIEEAVGTLPKDGVQMPPLKRPGSP